MIISFKCTDRTKNSRHHPLSFEGIFIIKFSLFFHQVANKKRNGHYSLLTLDERGRESERREDVHYYYDYESLPLYSRQTTIIVSEFWLENGSNNHEGLNYYSEEREICLFPPVCLGAFVDIKEALLSVSELDRI